MPPNIDDDVDVDVAGPRFPNSPEEAPLPPKIDPEVFGCDPKRPPELDPDENPEEPKTDATPDKSSLL